MLLKHFKSEEFRCRCGCQGPGLAPLPFTDLELLNCLEEIREAAGKPVYINSGYRCPEYNERVRGVKNSYHTLGKAADIRIKDMSPQEVYNLINRLYPDKYGIGLYATFVHFDVRKNKTRFRG